MIRELLLLLHIYLVTQKTYAIDIVTKDFPASIECTRTKQQRQYERAQASTDNYRACYNYIIDDDGNCIITNPVVEDIAPFTVIDSETTLYLIETPLLETNLYPSNLTCFFVIGKKKNGFVYQYFHSELFTQDLEGLLTMTQNNNILQVTGGLCQDFFEFYEKEYDNNNTLINENELVTCGKIPDPRIQFQIDVATTINLVFKSDGQNEFGGVNLYVLEIKPSPNPLKRKKRDVDASPGEQGDIGDIGRKGAPGEPGSTGIPGRNGSEGIKGERGSPGVIGPEGDIGLPGDTGIPGDSGPNGPKGTSCTCPSFTNCEPGIPGRKGSKGSRGSRGDKGPRGHRGEPGPPGPKGRPGEKGRKGSRGPSGAKGLPGPTGDQGLPGVRGKAGPPGPPGLAGCPLPDDTELSRRIREVGHIFATTTELYNSLGIDNKMSADEFYDFVIKRSSFGKDTEINLSDSDESRVDRNTESSTDCNGITVVSGPKGDQGVPGLSGNDGLKGKSGIPGINGTDGKAGDPGTSGLQGTKGSRGDKGLRGPKGDEGIMGPPGDSGYCQCYQAQEEAEAGKKTYSQTKDANGIPGRPGTRGLRGQKGPSGSVGETGSPGKPGMRGKKGVKGIKGVTGRTGSNGEPGDKGKLGQQGLPGPTGPPGPPGPPGCVCNNLIILLDKYGFVKKNTEVPINEVFGRTNVGDNWSGKTNYSTKFLFKPNITCIRNDSGPAVIGPKGEQGLPGFPGASGDPGMPGLPGGDGVQGMKGTHGDPGLYGSNGKSGLSGKMGSKGAIGADGKQGPPGDNAECILGNRTQYLIAVECPKGCPNGLDGAAGEKGDTGLKGFSGFKGFTGLRGPPGQRGVAGLPGLPGDEGITGKPGVKGPQGIRGLPGAVGPAGPPGPPGPSDSCPEYDGVDFDVFLSASQEDIDMIQYLLKTSNVEVATSMTKKEFPLLRELAKCVTKGYNFTKPKKTDCPKLTNPTNGNVVLSKNGKKAQFYCRDGFTIKGEETAVCENGKWSSWLPVCSKTNSITN